MAFILRLVVIYGVLAYPWPGSKPAAVRWSSCIHTAAAGFVGLQNWCTFGPLTRAVGNTHRDMAFTLHPPGLPDMREAIFLQSRLHHYLPVVLTLSLVLASALGPNGRWQSLFYALSAIGLAILLQTLLIGLLRYGSVTEFSTGEQLPAWFSFAQDTSKALRRGLGKHAVPCAIWLATTWRSTEKR